MHALVHLPASGFGGVRSLPVERAHGALPAGRRWQFWRALMDCAIDAQAPEIQAVAGVIATAFDLYGDQWLPLCGLDATQTRDLMSRWFPHADAVLALNWDALESSRRSEARLDEVEDLVALLMDSCGNARRPADEGLWLANALGQASLGANHLWQDLHLPSRRELSALMLRWFPRLAARNDRDMKWKKFLYKQLCDRAELSICRAPSCGVCSDYARCFGPEDSPLV